jgi:Ser/Thr protein kinase RdoA (MazF antagonist)
MYSKKIELSEETVKSILTDFYNLGEILSIISLESGHESDNVKFSTSEGDYVLKLHFYPQLDSIRDKMHLHELLHEAGVKIPIPIKTRDKDFVAIYDKENLLVVHTFISGKPIQREDEKTMFRWMKWFGKQFGIYHKKSKDIPLEKIKQKVKNEEIGSISPPPGDWVLDRYKERDTILPEHEKNEKIIESFEQFVKIVDEIDMSKFTAGLTHGDIFPGNFFKENGELKGILDFGGGYDYLASDLGTWVMYTSLYKPENRDHFKDFIKPYLKHSEIPVEELKLVPLLLKSRSYLQYFYFAFRIHNNITQGLEDEELEEAPKHNWKGFTDGIYLVETANALDNNYFYDIAVQALQEIE